MLTCEGAAAPAAPACAAISFNELETQICTISWFCNAKQIQFCGTLLLLSNGALLGQLRIFGRPSQTADSAKMGNSSAKSAACKEALLSFDSQQVSALESNFRRVAGMRDPKDRIDEESLSREMHLGGDLDSRLYRALHKLSGSDKPLDKGLKYDHFVVALTKCCSSSRYDKRQFWMTVVGEADGSVTKAELHVFFKILIGMTLKLSLIHISEPTRPRLI
eukprot:1794369-Rhodomonas_salina.1